MDHDPYRAPKRPAPAAEPTGDPLGSRLSTHAPAPLHTALVGPVLITCVVTFGLMLFGLSAGPSCLVGVLTLGVLAWGPLRVYGTSVDVHAQGLALRRGALRTPIPFDEINETWFEIRALHTPDASELRAVRIVDFAGNAYRVPLEVGDRAALQRAIFRGSEPLLVEARRALAEGGALTFGPVRVTRADVTIASASLPWGELRLVRISATGFVFFRKGSILAWRKLRLSRVPNPHLFVALVAEYAPRVDRDGVLFDDRSPSVRRAARARSSLVNGAIVGLAGIWITVGSGFKIVAWGALVVGGLRLLGGLFDYKKP